MAGWPYAITVQVAFTGSLLAPSWTDVTGYVEAFDTSRGRATEDETIDPGELTLTLDNTDGRFDPDNTTGPYYGTLKHNRPVRVSVQHTSSSPVVYLFTGLTDSWTRTWPGGGAYSRTTVRATDEFKLLTRRTVTGYAPQAGAVTRLRDILDLMAYSYVDGINTGGHSSRLLIGVRYDRENALQAMQDVAGDDGGALFISGSGALTYQPSGYRTSSVRATTSNGTFGNTPGAIPVADDLTQTMDDRWAANTVFIRDGNGTEVGPISIAAAAAADGRMDLDLGETRLLTSDAEARATEVVQRRATPQPRYDTITLDALTDDQAMAQALNREIGDRITVSLAPQGGGSASSRDQFVQGIDHAVVFDQGGSWQCTLAVNAV